MDQGEDETIAICKNIEEANRNRGFSVYEICLYSIFWQFVCNRVNKHLLSKQQCISISG